MHDIKPLAGTLRFSHLKLLNCFPGLFMSRVNLTKYHISSDPYPAGFFWNSCHVYNLAPKSGPSESRSPLQVDRGSKETNLILANPTAPMTLLELLSNPLFFAAREDLPVQQKKVYGTLLWITQKRNIWIAQPTFWKLDGSAEHVFAAPPIFRTLQK